MGRAGEGKPPDLPAQAGWSNEQQGQRIKRPFGHRQVPEGLFCL